LRGVLVPGGGAAPPARGASPSKVGGDLYQLTWQAVPTDSYTLELRVWPDDEPLLAIEDVVVPPPEGGDPRLVDIDLRDRVAVLQLRFVDTSGAPIAAGPERGLLYRAGLGPDDDWPAFEVRGAVAAVVARAAPINLLACLPGYRPRELRGLVAGEGELEVWLDRWPEVELSFARMGPQPAGATVLAALVQPQRSERGRFHTQWSSGPRRALEEPDSSHREVKDGRVRLPVGNSPRQLMVWLRRDGGGDNAEPLEGVEPREVTAAAAGSVLEVRVPAASWQRAWADLEQRARGK
jgi:hypothetical protein